jgi:hypothetical protein
MVHVTIDIKPEIELAGAGGLTVGDWVEVPHDFSPGHNSGGGVAVILEVIDKMSHVRYVLDSHVEKFVPLTRMMCVYELFRSLIYLQTIVLDIFMRYTVRPNSTIAELVNLIFRSFSFSDTDGSIKFRP